MMPFYPETQVARGFYVSIEEISNGCTVLNYAMLRPMTRLRPPAFDYSVHTVVDRLSTTCLSALERLKVGADLSAHASRAQVEEKFPPTQKPPRRIVRRGAVLTNPVLRRGLDALAWGPSPQETDSYTRGGRPSLNPIERLVRAEGRLLAGAHPEGIVARGDRLLQCCRRINSQSRDRPGS